MYFDWEAPFDCLDNESLGELFRGIFKYAKNNEEPNFTDPTLYIIFSFIKTSLDRDMAVYEEKCRKNSENKKKGAANKPKTSAETPCPPHDFNSLLKTLS